MTMPEIIRYLLAALSIYMLVAGTIPFTFLFRFRGYRARGHFIRLAGLLFIIVLVVPTPFYIKVFILILAHGALIRAAVSARKKYNSDNLG